MDAPRQTPIPMTVSGRKKREGSNQTVHLRSKRRWRAESVCREEVRVTHSPNPAKVTCQACLAKIGAAR